jgi:hypothetical protein
MKLRKTFKRMGKCRKEDRIAKMMPSPINPALKA